MSLKNLEKGELVTIYLAVNGVQNLSFNIFNSRVSIDSFIGVNSIFSLFCIFQTTSLSMITVFVFGSFYCFLLNNREMTINPPAEVGFYSLKD